MFSRNPNIHLLPASDADAVADNLNGFEGSADTTGPLVATFLMEIRNRVVVQMEEGLRSWKGVIPLKVRLKCLVLRIPMNLLMI